MFFRLNTLDLRPKETSDICVNFDPSDLRRDIAQYGSFTKIDQQAKV